MKSDITTASEAIKESIMRNRIVNVNSSPEIVSDLLALCDDNTDSGYGESITEYWGNEDGEGWRVHVYESKES